VRILQVSKFVHHVGGVETYLGWLTRALVDAGHAVAVVAMAPPVGTVPMDLRGAPMWLTRTRSFEAGSPGRVRSAAASVWSPEAGATMSRALETFAPEVVHFHGTCYQLTSAVVRAARRAGVAAVLTAHEYKLICANQTFFDDRAGALCTSCVGAPRTRRLLAPPARRCLKGSLAASGLGALEQLVSEPTWRRAGPRILAPSRFMRDRLVEDGWSRDRVRYLDLPWRPEARAVDPAPGRRDRIVFASRLVPLKGPELLVRAWHRIADRHPGTTLELLGTGSQEAQLRALVRELQVPRVEFAGVVGAERVRQSLDRALVTAHPSQCHENSPFAVRESLMAGVPCVVSDVGGMPDMVSPGTGWVVPHGDVGAWAAALDHAVSTPAVGTPALIDAVMRRSQTDEAHLDALVAEYAAEHTRQRGAG